ncbi:RAMP superfamily CRISPR-associated protein [Plantactinospora sp. B5E13]|uniref:RAMP superfamily CRISPR-associated protein n=1 Tax=Plantactinospora sp. B5E13 TaxID=3153758 RepID=UPI00325D3BE0
MTPPPPPALAVTVVARQRLALGVASEVGYYTASHPYVPGSVLRGALAAAWITEHGPPGHGNPATDEFRTLFDGHIRYGHLLPDGSHRTPLSVYRCKYPTSDACHDTVVDQAFETGDHCPACGMRLEQSRGDLDVPGGLTRITRTSIDPTTGRAKDGELYANSALPAGTTLSGLIHGYHPWLAQPRTLWLGGRRTVGGQAELTTTPHHPPAAPPAPEPGQPLVVRLTSPAVFVDPAGRPRLEPEPTLDLTPGATLLPGAWTRPVTWAGWHAASRLPKPTDLCAEAGSTYRITGPPDILATLAERLGRDGIGLRRAEGFGSVTIATGPWRPAHPPPQPETDGADPLQALHNKLVDLRLDDPAWRWLTGALRALQIEQHRTGGAPVHADLLNGLLSQPTAADLSGRQRTQLHAALVGLTPATLRDLTTLVLATPAADRRRSSPQATR